MVFGHKGGPISTTSSPNLSPFPSSATAPCCVTCAPANLLFSIGFLYMLPILCISFNFIFGLINAMTNRLWNFGVAAINFRLSPHVKMEEIYTNSHVLLGTLIGKGLELGWLNYRLSIRRRWLGTNIGLPPVTSVLAALWLARSLIDAIDRVCCSPPSSGFLFGFNLALVLVFIRDPLDDTLWDGKKLNVCFGFEIWIK